MDSLANYPSVFNPIGVVMKKEELELILSAYSSKEIVLTDAQYGMVNYEDFSDILSALGFIEVAPEEHNALFVVLVECSDKSFVVLGNDAQFVLTEERLTFTGVPNVENVRCYAKIKGTKENLDRLPLDILWLMSGVSAKDVMAKRLKRS